MWLGPALPNILCGFPFDTSSEHRRYNHSIAHFQEKCNRMEAKNSSNSFFPYALTQTAKYDIVMETGGIMKSTESKEMYLETILKLSERGQRVKSVDVANELGFSRPSVSVAVKTLEENDFVEVRENGELVLTQKGNETARKIYERHLVLTGFLMKVGADRGVAEENACRIEHVITDDMFELIKKSV